MTQPRVFVGTLHSGEAEFEECKRLIVAQEQVSITHHVISGLPEKEAHNALWDAWDAHKTTHDLFVKVDADTVLAHETVIARAWFEIFAQNKRVTGLQLRLQDFYTGGLIAGLNFFTPRVTFARSQELFCDHVDGNHDIVLKGESLGHHAAMEPAGFHCLYPNDEQAFHFGLHRALKGQVHVLSQVLQHNAVAPHHARELALEGARVVAANPIKFAAANSYTSTRFKEALAEAVAKFGSTP